MKNLLNYLIVVIVLLLSGCGITGKKSLIQELTASGCEIVSYKAIGVNGSIQVRCRED